MVCSFQPAARTRTDCSTTPASCWIGCTVPLAAPQVLWELATREVPRRGFVAPPPPSDDCPQVRQLGGCWGRPAVRCPALCCPSQHAAADKRCPPRPATLQGLSDLIGECLQQDPALRPTAQQALERLQGL